MPPSKYLSLASSRLSSLKEYVAQARDDLGGGDGSPAPQNWKQWAGQLPQKIRRNKGENVAPGSEEIALFPGWAVRRYGNHTAGQPDQPHAFSVDVFVSGYASSRRSHDITTRSQRAFLRIAKTFAALPKLPSDIDTPSPSISSSTENLLSTVNLPPRPTEISEDYEIQVLEQQFATLGAGAQEPEGPDSPPSFTPTGDPEPQAPIEVPPTASGSSISSDARRLHTNLELRLRPFWSTALAARTVRILIFASTSKQHGGQGEEPQHAPLTSGEVPTNANGFFSATFTVRWEDICRHPGALHMTAGNIAEEHDILVVAEMLPPPSPPPTVQPAGTPVGNPNSYVGAQVNAPVIPTTTSTLIVPLTHSPLRVVSDIDDTVKFSNILSGARAVFKNVFVKDLHEITIPGMGEWYSEMWQRGVRFHYVSNGPFELLPVVSEFIHISQLPPGSIKLKSYAGRSLFNGLLTAPAARKRAGVLDILTSFPTSQFILVGDTGEQDLELYASLASERPAQVVGVFVRDVNAAGLMKAVGGVEVLSGMINSIDDPTGARALTDAELGGWVRDAATVIPGGDIVSEPETYSASPTNSPPPPPPRSSSSVSSLSLKSSKSSRGQPQMSEPERKRYELQMRIWKARIQIPAHIPLRAFRRPEECVEAKDILEKFC